MAVLDEADKREPEYHKDTAEELEAKIASMKARMVELREIEAAVEAYPDKQIFQTDPDSRSMAKAGGGTTVGYNVQTVVDSENHLIVAHEVTNATTDRSQLSSMVAQAKEAVSDEATEASETQGELTVVADAGYYKGEEILECKKNSIQALVPKVDTSGKRGKGQFTRAEFIYDEKKNEYRCPAGERLTYKRSREEKGRKLLVYRTFKCPGCPLKAQCTTGKDRRIERWEHEQVLEDAADNLRKNAGAMRLRKQIVEHPYGTIKHQMGATHFVMKRLPNVQAEMSLHVLAYNLKRVINIVGVPTLMAQLQAV
jgi:hypothetical protein